MTADELLKFIVLKVVWIYIISWEEKKNLWDVLMFAVEVPKIIRDADRRF